MPPRAAYAPIERRLVSDAVHARLREDILHRRLEPGDALPSERALSEAFGVNRHAVREALKRLQQAGLVEIAQGGATRVRDWRSSGGLDLLTDLGEIARGPRRRELLLAIAEMRACLGTDGARMCAERAPAVVREELRVLGEAVAAGAAEDDFELRAERYERIWALIIDGCGNVAYRLGLNSLVGAQRMEHVDVRMYESEIDDGRAQRALTEAIAGGDAGAAERSARELLERTVATLREER